ncbi:MAG: Hsp20/alpha crystallin family protein [Saprospiraceae bacterium]|nr:Hsp20/alpha crystallin family protein [Saprospiraceae bacterium]
MSLVKFQPAPFQSVFNDFFNASTPTFANQPAVNILETAHGFRIELAAPGLPKEAFSLKVEKNILTISAKQETSQEENNTTYRRREFGFMSFERSFRLPETIDTEAVKAAFNNGILSVELTKKPEHQPVVKTIEVA